MLVWGTATHKYKYIDQYISEKLKKKKKDVKNKPRKVSRVMVRGPRDSELVFREGTDLKWGRE